MSHVELLLLWQLRLCSLIKHNALSLCLTREDRRFAHAKKEEGSGSTKAARIDTKAISVTAWLLAYADEMGDPMPDEYAKDRTVTEPSCG